MATVGVYLRVKPGHIEHVRKSLDAMRGVTAFDLDDASRLCAIVESPSLDNAHHLVRHEIENLGGVDAAWPVYVNIEDELTDEDPPAPDSRDASPPAREEIG